MACNIMTMDEGRPSHPRRDLDDRFALTMDESKNKMEDGRGKMNEPRDEGLGRTDGRSRFRASSLLKSPFGPYVVIPAEAGIQSF